MWLIFQYDLVHPATVQGYGFIPSDDRGFRGLGGPHLASDHVSGVTFLTMFPPPPDDLDQIDAIFNGLFSILQDVGFLSNFLSWQLVSIVFGDSARNSASGKLRVWSKEAWVPVKLRRSPIGI